MSYCLKLRAGPVGETRRVALEEVAAAIERLRASDIHQTRRHLKQVRALLALAHDDSAKEQARALRDAARHLSPARDREVCLNVLKELENSEPALAPALIRQVRAKLDKESGSGNEGPAVALRCLESALVALAGWVPAVSLATFEQRLRHSYRRSRRAVKAARIAHTQGSDAENPEALHEVRKCIKRLWAQLRLLRRCRPEWVKKLIHEADCIAELLGDEHDLTLLHLRLCKPGTSPKFGPLIELIVKRRAALGKKALTRAERFLKEPPRQFARQIFKGQKSTLQSRNVDPNCFLVVLLTTFGALVWPMQALEVPLSITNVEAVAKSAEPITSGVPFSQGVLPDPASVRILSGTTVIPAQFRPTALWPDHSVRWLLCDFQVNLPAAGTASVKLQTGTTPLAFSGVSVSNLPASLQVNTGAGSFVFDKTQLALAGRTFLATYGGQAYTAMPVAGGWVVEENGPMKAVIRVDGGWSRGSAVLRDSLIGFRARLFFYRNNPVVRVAFTFRNNNSFGWDSGLNRRADLSLAGLSFGSTALLPAGGAYVFGSGVEKTFQLSVPATPALWEARYTASGGLAAGWHSERPLALASPAYYAATGAWGRIALPVSGLASARQPDFDRFEKMQRAKVDLAAVENPPGLTGITAFGHLAEDLASWNNYGCLRWGGEQGPWSGNHYDWSYGMYLQLMRSGYLPYANLARVMARHEIDLDIYHTGNDGTAYNYQKNWETRPSHSNSDNGFGGGRPTHTWTQGYALHWLLTGDPRGRDGYQELMEGIREYLYESFNDNGHVNTNEIRTQGWLVDNLVTLWRIDPNAVIHTESYGDKTVPAAIKDVLQNVFAREAAAGSHGFVYAGDPDFPNSNTRHPLQNCYFIEAAAKAYEEVYVGRDDAYAGQLLALLKRMTRFLMGITYGGDFNSLGLYRPRQIPEFMNTPTERTLGQIPYLLMASNAAGFCYLHGGEADFLSYMRSAFQDYSRYFSIVGEEGWYVAPALRMPTSYNSCIYVDTESKVHGWSSRYGMYALIAEQTASAGDHTAPVVSALRPPTGATGVCVSGTLVLTFAESIRTGSGNIVLCTGTNGLERIPIGNRNVVVSGSQVTIDPAYSLVPGTVYSVLVDRAALVDLAGNPFAGITDPQAWRFTTLLRPVAPTPVRSAGTAPSGRHTFSWGAAQNAESYTVETIDYEGMRTREVITGRDGLPPRASLTVHLRPGRYTWRVRVQVGGLSSEWSRRVSLWVF